MSYQGLYIQKTKDGSSVKEITSDFGIWCKEFPFKIFGDAKDLYSNDWHDEDGDDEYIPSILNIKSYEIEVTFIYNGLLSNSASTIRTFLDFLYGKDGSGAEMKIYDPYYKIGRQYVRVSSIDDDATFTEYDDEEGSKSMVEFKVKFKVNDPVTDITLSK